MEPKGGERSIGEAAGVGQAGASVETTGRVQAGDLIGHGGDTSNARGASPHLHIEYHPAGGAAGDP